MKRVITILGAALLMAANVFAHGDAVHIRGTITKVSGNAVTIRTADTAAKTVSFTIAPRTEIDRGAAVASLRDLKVGDRIVVELPRGKTEAASIRIGAATTDRR